MDPAFHISLLCLLKNYSYTFALSQAMILIRCLHQLGQPYHEKMERDLAVKKQIRALEKVLEMAKKKTEEEETSRKAAEAAVAKVKNDFHTYRKRKSDEKKQFAADA